MIADYYWRMFFGYLPFVVGRKQFGARDISTPVI